MLTTQTLVKVSTVACLATACGADCPSGKLTKYGSCLEDTNAPVEMWNQCQTYAAEILGVDPNSDKASYSLLRLRSRPVINPDYPHLAGLYWPSCVIEVAWDGASCWAATACIHEHMHHLLRLKHKGNLDPKHELPEWNLVSEAKERMIEERRCVAEKGNLWEPSVWQSSHTEETGRSKE